MPQPFADELRSIQFSPTLSESLERARVFAREQQHRAVLLEHLLLALTEDADAAAVMQVCNVDPVRLGTDASGYLGRLLEDMRAPPGFEPLPDAELLRVLQAAGQACTTIAQAPDRRRDRAGGHRRRRQEPGGRPAQDARNDLRRGHQRAAEGYHYRRCRRAPRLAAPAKSAPQSASPPAAAAVEPGAAPALAALGEEAAQTPRVGRRNPGGRPHAHPAAHRRHGRQAGSEARPAACALLPRAGLCRSRL